MGKGKADKIGFPLNYFGSNETGVSMVVVSGLISQLARRHAALPAKSQLLLFAMPYYYPNIVFRPKTSIFSGIVVTLGSPTRPSSSLLLPNLAQSRAFSASRS